MEGFLADKAVNMTIEVALLISFISVAFSVFFGLKNNKRSDVKDVEQRIAESTKTNMKLDEIGRNVTDIKYDISSTKNAVQGLTERMVKVEASADQAHNRLDRMENGGKTHE